jgi:oligopeptide/dipeptide ABC transporter ATP-binding protein
VPKISKLEVRFIPDRQTQMAEVLSGGMDLIMNVAKDQADQAGKVPHLQVVSGETMRIVFLQMNTLEGAPAPQFKDIRVRKAILHAIDREAITKNIVGAGSRVLHTVCFPSQFGCTDEGAPRYAYDPALSKKLLAEAGFPNGFETEIHAYRERNQTEAIIGNLQAVGIRAKLNFAQYAAMREQVRANKSSLSHQTWGSFSVNDVSAATPVYFAFGADDITRDAEVRDALNRGDNSVDPNVRKTAYRTALDVTIQAQILRLLADLQRDLGIAMVLITHDLGVVARVAHRVAVMYAGEVVEEGTAAEVFGAPQHLYTRGLLDCIPVPGRTAPGALLGNIPGSVPSLIGAFEGCGFRERCGHAQAQCAAPVALRETRSGHRWRCVLEPAT